MAQTIKLKRSSVQNNVPSTSDLELGELAINTHDGKLFIKKDDGSASIVQVGGIVGTSELTDGSVTTSKIANDAVNAINLLIILLVLQHSMYQMELMVKYLLQMVVVHFPLQQFLVVAVKLTKMLFQM